MASLYKLSIRASPASENATAALLQNLFQRTACVETDLEKGTTHVSVFLERAPSRSELKSKLPAFALRKLRHENWAEAWKRHFKPISIGSRLLIKPGWSQRKAKTGQAVVVLDPGLSFGTGQHATTRFCLEEMVKFRRSIGAQSFLDVGTGSGILAIAAAKLGYSPVTGFDLDAAAVRIAKANATRNRVQRKIRLMCKDLADEPLRSARKYDLVCANLLSDLLVEERERLLNRLKPGGRLVIAGILESEFSHVQESYAGLKLVASRAEHEWRSGAFER